MINVDEMWYTPNISIEITNPVVNFLEVLPKTDARKYAATGVDKSSKIWQITKYA